MQIYAKSPSERNDCNKNRALFTTQSTTTKQPNATPYYIRACMGEAISAAYFSIFWTWPTSCVQVFEDLIISFQILKVLVHFRFLTRIKGTFNCGAPHTHIQANAKGIIVSIGVL